MKKTILALFLLMLVGVAFCENGMKVKIDNYSITVPAGWMAQRTDSSALFILYSPLEENDDFQENGNLSIEQLPSKYSVKGYLEASREYIKTIYSNFNLIETKDNYQIITGEINGTKVQQIQFVFMKGNVANVLTFTSNPENFARYLDTFKKIQKSFKY